MKLNFVLTTLVLVNLTGCGAMMDSVALYHDRADSCQSGIGRPELGRPENYKVPDYCRAGSRTATTNLYSPQGQWVGRAVTRY